MSGRYTPVPNPLAQSADHEIDAAFGSDDEDDDSRSENAPLNPHNHDDDGDHTHISRLSNRNVENRETSAVHFPQPQNTLPGSYDFEADPFDYAGPPPGSPPRPTHYAVPNPYGNSNGVLPTVPAIPHRRDPRRSGFFRRAVGALLPSYYQRVPTEEGGSSSSMPVGDGMNNDGVFANITAKPARGVTVQDGESIYVVPEEVQKEAPPSYAVAQADQVPAYYETFVHTPSMLDGDLMVDGMPPGSIFTFAWTMLISLSFQFVGFLFTYLLHTTHAARYGSRAGLGVTIIQYAFFLRRRAELIQQDGYDDTQDSFYPIPDFTQGDNSTATAISTSTSQAKGVFSPVTMEWLSFFLMSAGWFILLTSFLGYWRVKRWEQGIRQANEPVPSVATIQRDRAGIFSVFGLPLDDELHDENGLTRTPGPQSAVARSFGEQEAQLARDLRASGLL